jgi:hypothetical protein
MIKRNTFSGNRFSAVESENKPHEQKSATWRQFLETEMNT